MSNEKPLFEVPASDSSRERKIRQDWIDACEFHPLTNGQVLGQVLDWIRKDRTDRHILPVLLLDLDSTLYEVGPRSHQILKEWLDSVESRPFAGVRDRIAALKAEEVGYSLLDTFTRIGLSTQEEQVSVALRSAKHFWGKRFFTNEYLAYDHAYPGASEFVQEAYDLGTEIIYLTGRDEPGMGKGTRERLLQDAFPFDRERTHLLLKKSFELDDLDHKSKAADYVKRTGNLVASFENEPPNLVALSDLFPAAMHVFVDTVYSDRPAPVKAGLYRITGFDRN
jgi:hypothetical protein